MAVLRAHPQWKHLERLLERVAQSEYDRLGSGLEHDEYLAQVGAYQACRRMVDLVDTLIEKAKDADDRTADNEQYRRDTRKRITVSSPYWQQPG